MKTRRGAVVDISGLGIIPRILFATDGGITHILEACSREPVDLVRLATSTDLDQADRRDLGVAEDEAALRRQSVLQGRRSGRVFVHADSLVILDRIPEPVADELVRTGTSLLKLLAKRRIGTFRESIAEWEGHDEQIAAHFGAEPSVTLVARTYQIVVGGRPVAWITETFPKDGFACQPPEPDPDDVTIDLCGTGREA